MNNKITITLKEKFIKSAETAKSISENFGIDYFEVCKVLNEIQGADVQEVKYADWIEANGVFRCSNCGYSFENEGYQHFFNFCPCCGAKMQPDENKEEFNNA